MKSIEISTHHINRLIRIESTVTYETYNYYNMTKV